MVVKLPQQCSQSLKNNAEVTVKIIRRLQKLNGSTSGSSTETNAEGWELSITDVI